MWVARDLHRLVVFRRGAVRHVVVVSPRSSFVIVTRFHLEWCFVSGGRHVDSAAAITLAIPFVRPRAGVTSVITKIAAAPVEGPSPVTIGVSEYRRRRAVPPRGHVPSLARSFLVTFSHSLAEVLSLTWVALHVEEVVLVREKDPMIWRQTRTRKRRVAIFAA